MSHLFIACWLKRAKKGRCIISFFASPSSCGKLKGNQTRLRTPPQSPFGHPRYPIPPPINTLRFVQKGLYVYLAQTTNRTHRNKRTSIQRTASLQRCRYDMAQWCSPQPIPPPTWRSGAAPNQYPRQTPMRQPKTPTNHTPLKRPLNVRKETRYKTPRRGKSSTYVP